MDTPVDPTNAPRGRPLLTSLFFSSFALLCFFPGLEADAASTVDLSKPHKCTAEGDVTVVFQADDTQKVLTCPAGWILEPTKDGFAYQGSDAETRLEDIFSGARLDAPQTGTYLLTLPHGSSRRQQSWYYTCRAPTGSDSSAGGSSPDNPPSINGPPSQGSAPSLPGPPMDPEKPGHSDSPLAPPELEEDGGVGDGSGDPSSTPVTPEKIPADKDENADPGRPGLGGNSNGPEGQNHEVKQQPEQLDDRRPHPEAQGHNQDLRQATGSEVRGEGEMQALSLSRSGFPVYRGARREARNTCRITIDVLPSNLIECAAAGATKTAAVSAAGERVAFKCGEGLALKPEELDRVFDDKDGLCASQVALTTLVRGSLSRLPPVSDLQAKPAAYVLRVDELPAEQQALCYKCVGTSTGAKTDEEPKEPLKECLVKIAVSSAASSQSCVADLLSFHPLLVLLALSSVH
ncbi:hypothetical protein BESB_081960 [Besnoitia besnoiti]|uniref:SRS domain-containing protein n=1 Tax=Besnoitia besnoiti TaxID=94643 RepID=A0A2A9MBK0_BESBE|nr:hypothetical protein BESB_081960 [Besnoitia besnoiti]PFH32997.1 hypothetical protein BESB_081960 [Besnoitia besnoiti]